MSELAVVANTGDDIEIYGAHVSPDPDLITYWLADRIDERGWGIAGDSFERWRCSASWVLRLVRSRGLATLPSVSRARRCSKTA